MTRKNQPVWVKLKDPKHINADNATVEAAMSGIEAEYEALCAEFSLVSV